MDGYELTRFVFLRSLGLIYLMGFLNVVNQYRLLVGENGLLPIDRFVRTYRFRDFPSLFWNRHSDHLLGICGWVGVALSLLALTGLSDLFGFWVYIPVWFALWILYLSYVNLGQTFYWFGWESMLLEVGFLAIFFGPMHVEAPYLIDWLLRWVLFRVMFGAGLIKLRGDRCWWNLTCLHYHYETQPMPNPLSWYFHQLPGWFHKFSVAFNHFVELVVPFGFFFPAPISWIAGGFTILFQFILILSGNLSWLNWLTIVVAISCFNNAFFAYLIPINFFPQTEEIGIVYWIILSLLTAMVAILSLKPALNLFSRYQAMNASFDSLHLVNTYGAFGAITKTRMEIIIEGTDDYPYDEDALWKEYEFKGKPGNLQAMPPVIAPYHLRLDWLMWFAAMRSTISDRWLITFAEKLLEGDPAIVKLVKKNPFPDNPPKYIRMLHYRYKFARAENWWERELLGEYLQPIQSKS